jgi:hypothetical protein
MENDWLDVLHKALAEQLQIRFPKATVEVLEIFEEPVISITWDLHSYQIVFDGDLKIVNYCFEAYSGKNKPNIRIAPFQRVYRQLFRSYDLCDPDADFEPLFTDLERAFAERLDDC